MSLQRRASHDIDPGRVERLLRLLAGTPISASQATELAASLFGPSTAPASSIQKRLWFLEQLHPATGAYHVPLALRLRGPLDADVLREALAAVVARHDILRTSLAVDGGVPLQAIQASVPSPLPVLTIDGDVMAGYAAALTRLMTETFDLAAAPVWRAALLRASAEDHCLAFVFHHVILDGWSRDLFSAELADTYRGLRAGRAGTAAPPLQYGEFAAWQHVRQSTGLLDDDVDYWTRELRGAPAGLDLGGDGLHATDRSMRGGVVHRVVSDTVGEGLGRVAAAADATTFAVGLAAWAAWLRQRTGVADLVITTPAAGRTLPQFAHLLGPVANTLALRIDVGRAGSFVDLARAVRRISAAAQPHQHAPLERVLERLRPGRGTSHGPLAQVAFTRERAPQCPDFPGLSCEVLHVDHVAVKTDLALAVSRDDHRWKLSLEYSADVFSASAAAEALDDFAAFLGELAASPDAALPAQPRTRGGAALRIPLTPVQARVWLDQQRSPETPLYNVAVAIDIAGHVDAAAVERAFGRLVAETDALRLSFSTEGGAPFQRVSDAITGRVDEIDLASLTDDERSAWLRRQATTPFRMEGPLFRSALVRTAPGACTWLLVQHHLVTDGWSTRLLLQRMNALYAEERGGDRTESSLPSFAAHARTHLAAPEHDDWWNARFSDVEAPRFFGALRPKSTTKVTRTRVPFDPALLEAFRRTAGTAARVPSQAAFAVCGAALAGLLHRMTGRETVAFGMPFHNRRTAQDRDVVGLLMNVLPIAVPCRDGDTFAALIDRINAELRATLRRSQSLPPASVRERACDVLLNVQVTALDEFFGHPAAIDWLHTGHERESLTLQFHDLSDGRTGFDIETHDDVFGPGERDQLVDRLMRMLRACAHDPATRIGDVALMDGGAEARALALSAGPAIPEAFAEPVINRILRTARAVPEVAAVVAGGETLTYEHLERRVQAIAGALLARGVTRDDVIAVRLDRNTDFVCAILGVLAAGAAYLPVDLGWPAGRIEQCLADAAPRLTIVPPGEAAADTEIGIDTLRHDGSAPPALPRRSLQDLAYVIYTSGSTGTPKGVEIVDRGLANYAAYAAVAFELTQGDRVLQFASLAFDTAVEEIFPTLSTGATLVLRDDAMIESPETFASRLRDLRISVLNLPTSYWHLLAPTPLPECVRLVLVGGEAMRRDAIEQWRRVNSAAVRLLNGYGPTEATVVTTFANLTRRPVSEPVPIGTPVWNAEAYVFEPSGALAPDDQPGELFIGGAGLARGYRHDPALTEQRFVPHPYRPGERLYRTGDLARRRPDGTLEFLGRFDEQLKIRGYRVQPQEIEARLRAHPAVADVAAAVVDPGSAEPRLAAYLVARPGHVLNDAELRAFLRAGLPEYMVPGELFETPSLPRMSNGKLDRATLGELALRLESSPGSLPPRNESERRIADVWAAVLGRPPLSIHDNFFDAGGHSLLATQFVARVAEAVGVAVPLRTLFEHPTVARLAGEIERLAVERAAGAGALPAPALSSGLGAPPGGLPGSALLDGQPASARTFTQPASPAQRRMWVANDADPTGAAYNLVRALRVDGRLDVAALREALATIVARHEALRTVFTRVDGTLLQVVSPHGSPALDVVAVADGDVAAAVRDAGRLPFDLAAGPLCRVRVLRLREDDVLCLVMHHIICDGWSLSVLSKELSIAYEAALAGRPAAFSRSPLPYREAVHRQESADAPWQAEALRFWRATLEDLPPRLPLPFDRARPERPSGAGGRVVLPLGGDALTLLTRLAREERTTPFVVLLSSFAMFLQRWSGAADIPIGTPVAGRNTNDVHDTIGLFVNTVVTRFRIADQWSLRDAVAAGRSIVFDALRHQAAPFESVLEALQPKRVPGESPLFQVMFALQTMTDGQERLGPSRCTPLDVWTETAKFDLTAFVFERPGRTEIALEFNRDVFRTTTIEAAAQAFVTLLGNGLSMPDAPLSTVEWLSGADRRLVLAAGRGPRRPHEPTITGAFAATAERRGEATAIECGADRVSYADLAARSAAIAAALQRLGVGSGDRVGIALPRGVTFVAAALAVLQAGAAYVPIDLESPADRIRLILDDADTRLVLVAGTPAFEAGERRVVDVGSLLGSGGQLPEAAAIDGDRPAYVMYTSGSTGEPKGIVVPHRAVTRLVLNTDYCQIDEPDRVGQAANLSFDAATFEVWGALLNGAALIVLPTEVVTSPRLLAARLRSDRVSVLFLTTSLFNAVAAEQPDAFATARAVLFGGEAADVAAVRRVVANGRPPLLLNGYGPTETTTFATACRIETVDPQALRIPIGTAIANTWCHVLDGRRQPVPFGVSGELYIGGDGVALGYFGRADLTEAAFVADPFEPGGRLYKTGDRCRMHPDGTIEFIERLDRQVKLRGFRIEPAEVEHALNSHPSVAGSVVDVVGSGIDHRLVAWVTLRDRSIDSAGLRKYLTTRVPGYLVPSTVAIVERLPLTRNGKIDRAQLPAVLPDETPARTPRRARDPLEAELVKIWEDVLQVSPIGTDDNFFELGGHSLLAATMIDRVETLFERRVPISALMNGPTIQALATAYWHAEAARGTPLVPVRDQGDRPPLFFVHGDFNGGGLYCSRLARRLDASQPFYVLALHGISNGHVGLSIQSMAAEYADLIRRARPTGPIALGGYCHGALVAFEAARLLSRDREVTNVLMVHPSPVEPRLLTVDRLLRVVTRMRGQDHAAHARTMVRVVMALAFLRRARAADVLGWVVKRVRRAFAPRPPKTDALAATAPAARGQIRRHDPALWESVVQAVIAYVPRAYAGSVSLLLPPELGAHAAKGWSRFARHVDVVTVPGDHRTCVTTHVETLGAAIESELAGSQRRQGGTSGPSAAPAN